MTVLLPFAPLFQTKTWHKASVLLIGTLLMPGRRTVTAALRVMGLKDAVNYAKYHHVLSRAAWSPLGVAECLLILLVKTFCAEDKALVFGIDETIERRWGCKIAARHLPRSGVFERKSFRQSERLALDQPDAVDVYSLGPTGMGAAGYDGVGPLRTLLCSTRAQSGSP
jgi:hypothetical protein